VDADGFRCAGDGYVRTLRRSTDPGRRSMTIFNYVTAILMLIIGLGLTHLLGDVVYAFQDRRRTRLHWLPMVWAAIVFSEQMQFLWGVYELKDLIREWSSFAFLSILLLALLLFVAGALVVPRDNQEGTDGWELFLENGRWSLAVLACYCLVAFIINPVFFGISIFALYNLFNLVLCTLLILILFARTKRLWTLGTIVFAVASAISIILLSPAVYE